MSSSADKSQCQLLLQQVPIMTLKNFSILKQSWIKTFLRIVLPAFAWGVIALIRPELTLQDIPEQLEPEAFAFPWGPFNLTTTDNSTTDNSSTSAYDQFFFPVNLQVLDSVSFCYLMGLQSEVYDFEGKYADNVPFIGVSPETDDTILFMEHLNATLQACPDNIMTVKMFGSSGGIDSAYRNPNHPIPAESGADHPSNPTDAVIASIHFNTLDNDAFQYDYDIRGSWIDFRDPPLKAPYTDPYVTEFVSYYHIFESPNVVLQTFVNSYIHVTLGNSTQEVNLVQKSFPYPAYTSDSLSLMVFLAPWLFVAFYFYPAIIVTKSIVEDKENKVKEGMRIMGLLSSSFWLSWYIFFTTLNLITCLLALWPISIVFKYSDLGILFYLIFLVGQAFISFGFFFSCFFSATKTSGQWTALVSIAGFILHIVDFGVDAGGAKMLASLSPFAAQAYTLQTLISLEASGVGLTEFTFDAPISDLSMNDLVGMLWVDVIGFLVLALYLDMVLPRQWGTPEPWYFPIQKSFWCGVDKQAVRKTEELEDLVISDENKKYFEEVPSSIATNIGVKLRGIKKIFGSFEAVAGIDLDIYEGELFALLGHNGAGKTTLMSMLTGLLPISAGAAEIAGNDVETDMFKIRQSLGLCPQHDVLFSDLNVLEHMKLFCNMKGIDSVAGQKQTDELIESIGLRENVLVKSKDMSGGQQRKLSVIIALLGDSKVVFLDEPTSGMDPFSRRACWDTLKRWRHGRTIVFTTHFMDEADLLGDRIAIMAAGQVVCCGSSLFLKSIYGVGYTFTCTRGLAEGDDAVEESDQKQLRDLVNEHVADSELLSDIGTEIAFRFPLHAASTFLPLLVELDVNKAQYGISNYGISVTTLEEVFLKVGHGTHDDEKDEAPGNNETVDDVGDEPASIELQKITASDDGAMINIHADPADEGKEQKQKEQQATMAVNDNLAGMYEITMEPASGCALFWRHFKALLLKRWNYSKRDYKALVYQVLIPIVILIFSLTIFQFSTEQEQTELPFSASVYNDPQRLAVNSDNGGQIDNMFDLMDGFQSQQVEFAVDGDNDLLEMQQWLLDHRNDNADSRYGALYISDPSMSSVNATVLYNTTAYHSLPVYVNQAFNALFKYAHGAEAYIRTTFIPLPFLTAFEEAVNAINSFLTAILICVAFCFIPASYAVFVVLEREIGAKHIQFISGVNSLSYWCAVYVWDMVLYMLPFLLAVIVIQIDGNESFSGDNSGAVILIFFLYGLSVCPFTYMLSFVFKSHASAQLVFTLLYLLTGMMLMTVSFVLDLIPATQDVNGDLKFIYRLFPTFCLGESLLNLALLTDPSTRWSMDVIGWNIVFMLIETVVYFLILVGIESLTHNQLFLQKIDPKAHGDVNSAQVDGAQDEDEDVIAERKKVEELIANKDDTGVLLNGIRKVYSDGTVAVKSVHFSVAEGECFGYLGTNGAGKTTTLATLTGDIHPTFGDAFIKGHSILQDSSITRQMIGYCPQFDALLGLLTARESLEFFARIKGVPESKIPNMVQVMITNLSLDEYADRPCGTYSGGNKRKLSVAMALMGNPPVVFLDEPSTGMDPMARRFMWNFISQTMAGRSVILTTHSMEECEALCNRVGIMVDGALTCIGSTQHLKSRHGKGFQLNVVMKNTEDEDASKKLEAEQKEVKTAAPQGEVDWILGTFAGSERIEKHGRNLRYYLPGTFLFSQIFSTLEAHKEAWDIAEYSVSQMSLEQVFLKFAQFGKQQNNKQLEQQAARLKKREEQDILVET